MVNPGINSSIRRHNTDSLYISYLFHCISHALTHHVDHRNRHRFLDLLIIIMGRITGDSNICHPQLFQRTGILCQDPDQMGAVAGYNGFRTVGNGRMA